MISKSLSKGTKNAKIRKIRQYEEKVSFNVEMGNTVKVSNFRCIVYLFC